MVAEDPVSVGKAYLFSLISRRPRSIHEARLALEKKFQHDPEALFHIDRIIDEMVERKYLDDAAFVRWWVEQRDSFRPKGPMVLEKELREKGIDVSVIRSVLRDPTRSEDIHRQVVLLAKQRLKKISSEPYRKKKEKLSRYLLSRGFSWEVISGVIDSLLKTSYNEQTLE